MNTTGIGIVGLGVMGANIARNFLNHQIPVVVYNRNQEVCQEFEQTYPQEGLRVAASLEVLVARLEAPRIIFVVVTAGQAVDMVLEQLLPHLDAGDMIIDFGNSHYQDTLRRQTHASTHGVGFIGCGLSGGEEGALHGPSLMAGGTAEQWEYLRPVLEQIAARDFEGGSCAAHVGQSASGHYVKMLHNGIEYGIMGAMAELYELFRDGYGLSTPQLQEVFASWNHGPLTSFLLETAVRVLGQRDPLTDGFVVDYILDRTGQKGTGLWTTQESLERSIPSSSIAAAVFQRITSAHKAQREQLANYYPQSSSEVISEDIRLQGALALEAAVLLLFVQGLEHLRAVSMVEKWEIDLSEVCRVWQGGCIIRMALLKDLRNAVEHCSPEQPLLSQTWIRDRLKQTMPALREFVQQGIQLHVSMPVLGSALAYVDAITKARGSGNFLQGLRDCFGAHTYERTDREGIFHTVWE